MPVISDHDDDDSDDDDDVDDYHDDHNGDDDNIDDHDIDDHDSEDDDDDASIRVNISDKWYGEDDENADEENYGDCDIVMMRMNLAMDFYISLEILLPCKKSSGTDWQEVLACTQTVKFLNSQIFFLPSQTKLQHTLL